MKSDGSENRSAKSLRRLAALAGKPPATSTGKVVWAWPQISTALQRGWRMFDVWSALRADGIEIPYDSFRVYVSRLRRRFARATVPPSTQVRVPESDQPTSEAPTKPAPQPTGDDPYSAIREQRKLKQQAGFEYDPFSTDKDLLE